jgi:hypothetical protein
MFSIIGGGLALCVRDLQILGVPDLRPVRYQFPGFNFSLDRITPMKIRSRDFGWFGYIGVPESKIGPGRDNTRAEPQLQ